MAHVGVDPPFWCDRRVIVTGHTGFKGSWLTLWLKELGAHVTGLAVDIPTSPSLYEEARVGEGVDEVQADVRDFAAVARRLPSTVPRLSFTSLRSRWCDGRSAPRGRPTRST